MRQTGIVIGIVAALQALLVACGPLAALSVASTVVKGAAVASVQDDEETKDCSQQGLAECEREWREAQLAQSEALVFAQTMSKPEPDPKENDAHEAFAAYLRSDEMSDGWVFLCTAANLGHPQAQLLLARAYKDGWEPVERNDMKAYTWYRLAIAGGHGFARSELKTIVGRMDPEVRTWAEINSTNWKPNYSECEVSLDETLQGA
jgi:TPR repeat protein